ncbi:MAG: hypothetical protein IT368_06120 [Candidatus Hydrogenedentes bacterium]|nr:hypothetical protein [Candidatus Hydrogenedentota bacterium]
MALFGRGGKQGDADERHPEFHPVVGRIINCGICGTARMFTRCWRRVRPMRKCPCCGLEFSAPGRLYAEFQPACPQCGEPLEQPGFDYGLCDACGSKYEIPEGAKPGLLPNRQQRAEMEKHGRVWRRD